MARRDLIGEAVFFFAGSEICEEMRFGEFEAVLDGAVPMTRYADQTVRGVYAVIASGHAVRAMACFLIAFDRRGIAESDWNVPVRELARNGGIGPDLGQGPTRLACRGQCSIPWAAARLWQPNLQHERNECAAVQHAVRRNRLALRDEPVALFDSTLAGIAPLVSRPADSAPAAIVPLARTQPTQPSLPALLAARNGGTAAPRPAVAPRPVADEPGAEAAAARARSSAASTRALAQAQLAARLEKEFGGDQRLSVEQLVLQYNRRLEDLQQQHAEELDRHEVRWVKRVALLNDELARARADLERERARCDRLKAMLRSEIRPA